MRSDRFQVGYPSILKKSNFIPFVNGPSLVHLANFPTMLDTHLNMGGGFPNVVANIRFAVFIVEKPGLR